MRPGEHALRRLDIHEFPAHEQTQHRPSKGLGECCDIVHRDRVTMLPESVAPALATHLQKIKVQHERDRADGAGRVELPDALARKYPQAAGEWSWQWVFPATRHYVDPRTGDRRRHHLHESVIQRAFREAVRASGIAKRASCGTEAGPG